MMRRNFFLLFLILIIVTLIAEEAITVTRERTYLRTGPGAYYDVVATLTVNSTYKIVGEENGWYKVAYKDTVGYVSQKTLKKIQSGKKSVLASLGDKETTSRVSRHGMSAGVKGFADSFSQTLKGDTNFADRVYNFKLDTKSYHEFVRQGRKTYGVLGQSSFRLPTNTNPDYFSYREEGLGISIASSVASLGIWENSAWTNYVNYLCTYMGETANLDDITYKVFILDLPQPNAYSFPGGIVFITRGMLEKVNSEAELATVIAHEMVHIAYFHGMMETEKRKNHIRSDEAFGELDDDLDKMGMNYPDEIKDVENELEDLAFSIYETLAKGRMDKYEQEADEVGLAYAAKSGYNPYALKNLLLRLQNNTSNNEHYRPESIAQRLNWVNAKLRKTKWPTRLTYNSERLQQMKNRNPLR